jgi:hypothetical protein
MTAAASAWVNRCTAAIADLDFALPIQMGIQMNNKLEVRALTFETLGLFLILMASGWQVYVSNWLNKQSAELVYYQRQDADIAVMNALKDISLALKTDDKEERARQLDSIATQTNDAIFKTFDSTRNRKLFEREYDTASTTYRFILFGIGSLLVLVGKLMARKHKENLAASDLGAC